MIPLFKVHYPVGIGQKIEDLFKSGIITEGEYSDKFEDQFSKFVGNPYTALVNSATSALVLAYRMCDVGPGTEVISTPMTCMATNEPIVNAGAKIVWADIDPTTGNIDPQNVESLITEKTKAIVGVYWAGQPFEIDEIMQIGRKYKIPVIADAAHALGSTYKNKQISTLCDYTVYSFQAIKHLTTADGGALACKNKLDFERIKLLRWFGIDRKYPGSKWEQDINECGYKFHMNNVNAIIGLEQMKYIDGIISSHKKNAKFFDENIKNINIELLRRDEKSDPAYWLYSVLVDDSEKFKKYMFENGIATDRVHVRNDEYTVFNDFRSSEGLRGCDTFCSKLMNIPVGWWLTEEDLAHIVKVVNSYV